MNKYVKYVALITLALVAIFAIATLLALSAQLSPAEDGNGCLNLVVASQPLTFGGSTYLPRAFDRWKLADWLGRAYPLSHVKVIYRTLPTLAASRARKSSGRSVN